MVKAEHEGLLVVLSSSSEEEAQDVNAVQPDDQVVAEAEIDEKKYLPVGQGAIT